MSDPLLNVADLSVAIGGRKILDRVSLTLGAGEILGLVGASGSGKSMTALAVMRLLPRHARLSGSVRLRGETLTDKTEAEFCGIRGRHVGIVFQEPLTALNPLMRIGDQVAETVRLHTQASRRDALRAARSTFARVGLEAGDEFLRRHPHELSGGQRQRVAIAMAIVVQPAVLIADEPTTALDMTAQAEILALLQELVHGSGMGLLLITHDMAVVSATAGRAAVMHEGRIVEQGAIVMQHAGAARRALQGFGGRYARALREAAFLPSKRARSTAAGGDPPNDGGDGPGPTPTVLEVCGIVREYPRPRRSPFTRPASLRAVDRVSLQVRRGETVGLIGESGSGKSSLLRVILALDRPQAGEVRLGGESITAARGGTLRRMRRGMQAVFQDPHGSFDPRWSVARIVAEPLHLLGPPPRAAERRRRVERALEDVGLSAADADRHPHEFSGGQRQRIAIARALIIEPAVVVFDEAVSALDVLVRAQILDLLAALGAARRVAMLFVSHDLTVIRSIADRVYVMRAGQVVEEGVTEQLFAAPRHAYTAALIAAMPAQ